MPSTVGTTSATRKHLKTVVFTNSGTWTPATNQYATAINSIVAVGGGGGASDRAGGGGGQVTQSSSLTIASSVSVTIGAGGTTAAYTSNTNGGDTTVTGSGGTITGTGGNKAGQTTGGSSGGGTYAGGTNYGGGGGAGGAGSNGNGGTTGGNGGVGVTVNGYALGPGGGGIGTNTTGTTPGLVLNLTDGDYTPPGMGGGAIGSAYGIARFTYYSLAKTGDRTGTGWTENDDVLNPCRSYNTETLVTTSGTYNGTAYTAFASYPIGYTYFYKNSSSTSGPGGSCGTNYYYAYRIYYCSTTSKYRVEDNGCVQYTSGK